MARDPSLRASDADRDATARLLRAACAEGRLTVDEYQERLDAAYRARTYGELDPLVADLPHDGEDLPVPASARPASPTMSAPGGLPALPGRRQVSVFAAVSAFCWAIWAVGLVTEGAGTQGFWPLWVTGLLALVLLVRPGGGHRPGGGRPH